jgi:hypothetical protein
MQANIKNQREAWLTKATRKITKKWAKLGVAVPADVQLSCGFPGGGSPRRRIGECWPRSRSTKGINQVFINPILEKPELALDVLGHELLHAADDCQSKHGHAFTRLSVCVGYSGGKNSQATSESAKAFIARLTKVLGPYPHGAAILTPKKQKSNAGLHKFECDRGHGDGPEEHVDVLYSTAANVEKFGAPCCRFCHEEMTPAKRKAKKVIKTI